MTAHIMFIGIFSLQTTLIQSETQRTTVNWVNTTTLGSHQKIECTFVRIAKDSVQAAQ